MQDSNKNPSAARQRSDEALPANAASNAQEAGDPRVARIRRGNDKADFRTNVLAAIPMIFIVIALVGTAPGYQASTTIRPVFNTFLVAGLCMSLAAAIMFCVRPLRPFVGVLAAAGVGAALGLNCYGSLSRPTPEIPNEFESMWSNRRLDNSLEYLINHGNQYSKITYRNFILMRPYLEGKMIVSYDTRAVDEQLLLSVTHVKSFDTEDYIHQMTKAGYQCALGLEHVTLRLDRKRSNRILLIVPEWARVTKRLYLITLPDEPVHLLVPGEMLKELAE